MAQVSSKLSAEPHLKHVLVPLIAAVGIMYLLSLHTLCNFIIYFSLL